MQGKESTEEEYVAEYNSTFVILTVDDLERLAAVRNNDDNESIESSYDTSRNIISSKHKLPKLELRKFNGDPKEWLGWWSQFQEIHDDVTLSMEHKFQYLIQATVKDSSASELVTSFPPTALNYLKAITYLQSRFGNDKILVEGYVRELLILILNNSIDKQQITIVRCMTNWKRNCSLE